MHLSTKVSNGDNPDFQPSNIILGHLPPADMLINNHCSVFLMATLPITEQLNNAPQPTNPATSQKHAQSKIPFRQGPEPFHQLHLDLRRIPFLTHTVRTAGAAVQSSDRSIADVVVTRLIHQRTVKACVLHS